jgi:hypothetical protein
MRAHKKIEHPAVGTFVGSICFLAFVAAWMKNVYCHNFPITYKILQNAKNRFGRSAKPLCAGSIPARASNLFL